MGGFSVDANRLFFVYIFVAEGRARGPTIPGIDGFNFLAVLLWIGGTKISSD